MGPTHKRNTLGLLSFPVIGYHDSINGVDIRSVEKVGRYLAPLFSLQCVASNDGVHVLQVMLKPKWVCPQRK